MLPVAFLIISFLYSTVGFGGGSSYLAMLSVSGIPFEVIPKISLICNLIVVTGGLWHFHRSGNLNRKIIFPFVFSSVPMAFLGGLWPIDQKTFLILLSVGLLLAGTRLLVVPNPKSEEVAPPSATVAFIIGALLGLLSGLVGLGGGIFLSPLLLNMKWGNAKEVAAASSAFIFLNSLFGLMGQLTKSMPSTLISYWPLYLAVAIGGQAGSRLSNHQKISQDSIRKATAVLILLISIRLVYKLFF